MTRRGRGRSQFAVLAAAGWGLLVAGVAFAAEPQGAAARYPLAPGSRVSVENVQGAIWVEGWDRAEVEVAVMKSLHEAEASPEEVMVAVEQSEGVLKVRTLYAETSLQPMRMDYRLRVPRQVILQGLRTLEGDITVRDVEGQVDARSLRGDIRAVNISGAVEARTVRGDILISLRALPEATLAKSEGGAPLRLEASSGNLSLYLPAGANADLEMSTTAGEIEGSYPATASPAPGDSMLRARLGRGGTRVQLRTIRGNIRVAQAEKVL